MPALKVIIVGGGLAGALLANGIVTHGGSLADVSVYERDNQEANRAGYQIRLGENSLKGLRKCLTPEQLGELMKLFGRSGGKMAGAPSFYDKDFNLLLDFSKYKAYHKTAPINRVRMRTFLQEPLLEKGQIHYGKAFTRFEVLNSESSRGSYIRAHFADGSSAECDLLIGAEGSSSRANKQLGCDNIVSDDKREGVLGKSGLPWALLQSLPRVLIEKGTLTCSDGDLSIFAAAYLPDDFNNEAVLDGAHADSSAKPLHYDESHAALMVGVSWNKVPGATDLTDVQDIKGLMLEKIEAAGWHQGYCDLVHALDEQEIYHVTSRLATWIGADWRQVARKQPANKGNVDIGHPRVWLIGDAIHPMQPTRGMGANQALRDTEDALDPILEVISRHAQDGYTTDDFVRSKLRDYEDKMIPRGIGWVIKSKQASQLPDFQSWKGKALGIVISQLLTLVGMFYSICEFLQIQVEHDPPELASVRALGPLEPKAKK